MSYTDEQIAEVCHEANRGLQSIQNDPHPSSPWASTPQDIRESAIEGVRAARRGTTPREQHEAWMRHKIAQGWQYGLVKDEQAKTHPCLVPYADLPGPQKIKDELFLAVVAVLASNAVITR